jgi:hypothetical protein
MLFVIESGLAPLSIFVLRAFLGTFERGFL